MTDSSGLERGYRRLLACYPKTFRHEQEEEILAVLMASARPGQRRPRLAESADLLRSALGMRLRAPRPGPPSRPWSDALALFSIAAPLFLLVADILEVALPYHLPPTTRYGLIARMLGRHVRIGGLPLFSQPFFDIAVGCQVIVSALVLLALRRLALAALAAAAVYWIVARHSVSWIPYPVQLLSAGVYILEAAALIASPGPRRGRHLMNWRHGVVLLVAAAAVQVSTLMYDAKSPPVRFLARRPPDTTVYLVGSIVLAVTVVSLAVAWKLNRYFLLLLAAMCYPYAMQLAFSSTGDNTDLLGLPTPGHLALLFLPPLLFAGGAVLVAVTPRRSRALLSPDSGQPV